MLHHRAVWYCAILFVVVAIGLCVHSAAAQTEESYEGFVSGLRSNAVKGAVTYQRKDGTFDLDPGLKFEEGDSVKTSRDGFAELLLQPGNYLRLGGDTDFQILNDFYDRMRLKLNHGSATLEILSRESGSFTSFYYTRAQLYELIRVVTPDAEVFITHTGIFRINALPGGRTELIVREGEAVINGRLVKKKRRAVSAGDNVTITEIDKNFEDAFDQWGRERAQQLVQANRTLKKESPWTQKRKEGEETQVKLAEDQDLQDELQQEKVNQYVVSAKPGTITFVDAGVQVSGKDNEWKELTKKSELQTGDKLRTVSGSLAELTVLPDMFLRIDENSEVLFEQLLNEAISIKMIRGSAILDVARFDRKQVPEIILAGPTVSVAVADDGNYRIDVKENGDQVVVREGKVNLKGRSIDGCHRITVQSVSDCEKRKHDNFDYWSHHRGEGSLFYFRDYQSIASLLARLRRLRFRNTGFWFQNPGQPHYTFVPFMATHFRSPYGGNYSTVLTPRRPTIRRVYLGGSGRTGSPDVKRRP